MRAYWSHWLCGESQHSLRGRNLRSLSSTLCPLLRSSPGTRDHRSFSLRSLALVKPRGRSHTTRDIFTRQFRDLVHYSKHSWDEVLQDFCLLGDYFICNQLHQRQNTLHPVAKTRGHLVILVLFFQELPSNVTSASGYARSEDTPQTWRWQHRRQLLQLGSTTRCQCISRSMWMGCWIADLCEDRAKFECLV